MSSGSSTGAAEDARSSGGADADAAPAVDSTVAEEVTRVEEVHYLEGASGHGVLSLAFLLGAVVLAAVGARGAGAMAVVVAYGVALNGLSIFAWDRLRLYFAGVAEAREADDGATRDLTPHRLSAEMKAELLAGFTMVGGFTAALGVGLAIFRTVGVRVAIILAVGALAVGNVGALARAQSDR